MYIRATNPHNQNQLSPFKTRWQLQIKKTVALMRDLASREEHGLKSKMKRLPTTLDEKKGQVFFLNK